MIMLTEIPTTTPVVKKIIDALSDDLKIAIFAGCELETTYNQKTKQFTIKTKRPILIKKNGHKINVYEQQL